MQGIRSDQDRWRLFSEERGVNVRPALGSCAEALLCGERLEHEKYGWGMIQSVRQTARGVQINVHFLGEAITRAPSPVNF